MKSKVTGINFEIGNIVKCIKTILEPKNTYFKIIGIELITSHFPDDVLLQLFSIDKRYSGNAYSSLYAYRFEKAGQEYIILKLKGIVE